ncbi:hypothetical protein BC936DRAFT_146482 [Jimgerdemannia flammicorona]|uniref:Uncharacterized protein n=2 Tax=Jimgerdemannia flammicorona TaxID=994334 RepID=A0A433Q350_9FUNG|nr:hypothetical protein BC936DRAFT_146482 [Jimgerdemannia flammicorona]RUS24243.1 hypothetical protein BC938DRAFT_473893 [Jimgerdemannia flammicorona]
MNPNVNYGQVVRGINSTHTGRKEGILSVRSLIDVPRAVEWLDNSKSWTKEDDDGIRAWFNEYYLWLINNVEYRHCSWFHID